jgi:hypothetical protein
MMTKLKYERPVVVDYGSIADHTFGDNLNNGFSQPGIPGSPNRISF